MLRSSEGTALQFWIVNNLTLNHYWLFPSQNTEGWCTSSDCTWWFGAPSMMLPRIPKELLKQALDMAYRSKRKALEENPIWNNKHPRWRGWKSTPLVWRNTRWMPWQIAGGPWTTSLGRSMSNHPGLESRQAAESPSESRIQTEFVKFSDFSGDIYIYI